MEFPSIEQIRELLRAEPTVSAQGLAARLHCSEGTLRRYMREAHGTSFVRERNRVRADIAFDLLCRGSSLEWAAKKVGVAPDHLGRILRREYRFSPRQIQHAAALAERLQHDPQSRAQLRAAERDDRILQELLGGVDSSHPLYDWARRLVMVGHHPERQTREYQDRLRRREREAFLRKRDVADAEAVEGLSISELAEGLDVGALLVAKQHAEEHMHMEANRRRRQGRGAGPAAGSGGR